jgi:hypothetical protein
MTAPTTTQPLPVASITITNATTNGTTNGTTTPSTSPTSNSPPTVSLADAMSGTSATASISIVGQSVTAQSGVDHTFVHPAMVLPMVFISSYFLI